MATIIASATAASAAAAPETSRELNDPALLAEVNSLRKTDNWRNWFYLAREYLFLACVIGGVICLYYLFLDQGLSLWWLLPVLLVSNLCVGAGQHRLATLTHEAAHYMLFRNRRLNEFVSEWFCMFPILGTTHSYRVQHLGHHQYPNDPDRDPDWTQMFLSGHRYKFPMTRWQFWWECVIWQFLWPPNLLRYVLVRASFRVHQGDDTPYRMKRFQPWFMKVIGMGYTAVLVGALAVLVGHEAWLFLGIVPLGMWLAGAAFYYLAPERWFEEYAVKPDIPVRTSKIMRLTFNILLASAIAWATVLTGMPWWLFYAVLWLVPLGSSFAFFMILRQIVQHGNADRERFTNTRVFLVNPLISMSVFPIGNDFHLPHHLFPMVPHYNLRRLHKLLMESAEYRDNVVVVKGYAVHAGSSPRHPTVVDLMTESGSSTLQQKY